MNKVRLSETFQCSYCSKRASIVVKPMASPLCFEITCKDHEDKAILAKDELNGPATKVTGNERYQLYYAE